MRQVLSQFLIRMMKLLGYGAGGVCFVWQIVWRRAKWMIAGFATGAFFGLSVGVAAGGDAVNGWFIFGVFGALLGYFLGKQFAKIGAEK